MVVAGGGVSVLQIGDLLLEEEEVLQDEVLGVGHGHDQHRVAVAGMRLGQRLAREGRPGERGQLRVLGRGQQNSHKVGLPWRQQQRRRERRGPLLQQKRPLVLDVHPPGGVAPESGHEWQHQRHPVKFNPPSSVRGGKKMEEVSHNKSDRSSKVNCPNPTRKKCQSKKPLLALFF